MLSQLPTQQPPVEQPPEQKRVTSTPVRRAGQTPAALAIKAILRPIIKGIYYLIQAIKNHKLVTLLLVLLLIATSSTVTYFTTGSLPFGVGHDQFNFNIRGGNGGGDHVKNWLYALRDGDTTTLTLINAELAQTTPPDPQQMVDAFSQTKAHLTWKSINVMDVYSESDTSVDSFVEVDLSANGPGGPVSGIAVWHFVTVPSLGGRIIFIDLVSFRKPLI